MVVPSLSNHPSAWEPANEWAEYPSWDHLFDDDNEIIVDDVIACSLENPETCESCQ